MTRFKNFVACSALAFALTNMASYGNESSQPRDQQPQSGKQSAMSARQPRAERQTIQGDILELRQVSAPGQSDRSLLRLVMDDGRTVVVDAGNKQIIKRLSLEKGDSISLTGKYDTTTQGRAVFRADRIRANGQTVAINTQSRQMNQTRSSNQQSRTVTGTIEGFRHMNVRGSQGGKEVHTLAKIEQENGRTIKVDLGPKDGLDDLRLQKGERVRVQARRGTLDGKHILLAEGMRLTDRSRQQASTQAGRSGSRQQQSQQQQQQVTIRGIVEGYQITSIGSGTEEQVLLSLRLQDGRKIVVDAGRYQPGELDLKNLNLQDEVVIKGNRMGSSNRQRLVAESIRFRPAQGGSSESEEDTSTNSSGSKSSSN